MSNSFHQELKFVKKKRRYTMKIVYKDGRSDMKSEKKMGKKGSRMARKKKGKFTLPCLKETNTFEETGDRIGEIEFSVRGLSLKMSSLSDRQ
jgi:hypothetical protein